MSAALAGLVATSEQVQLVESVARFVRDRYPYRDWRAVVGAEPGISMARWSEMAALGWLGLGLPEDLGGWGGSLSDSLKVVEGLAAGLVTEPYANVIVVAADLLASAAPSVVAARWLPAIVAGERRVVLAHDEDDGGASPTRVGTHATALEGGWRLDGAKRHIADAPHGDALIVSARVAGEADDAEGIALFMVPADTPGLSVRSRRGFDRRRLGDIVLDDVRVADGLLLGRAGACAPLLRRALDRRIAALAAEAVGLASWLCDATRDYLGTRVQFGAPLASFQVLQHRLVDMVIALEEMRTAAALAAIACDAGGAGSAMVSAAKAKVSRAGLFVGRQAIQLHGGMGMTDELPVGDFAKRLEAIALTAGGPDAHLDRVTAAGGLTG